MNNLPLQGVIPPAEVASANINPSRPQPASTSATPSSRRAQHRGHGRSAARNRQRAQHTSQLESITGLDIDLAESIVPTTSSSSSSRDLHKRKVNLTHLLNYKFERPKSSKGPPNSNRRSNHHYRDAGTTHKFNKQQFLQANCQFVVAHGYDYTIHKIDPDWPVDWDCIEEVRFKQSACSETTCPICLEPPIAAKITKCGHIYCWTCMLHYLSLSDEKRRQCPICFENVYESDLRSVISQSFTNYSVDEEINMRLMFRLKGCVEVKPYCDPSMEVQEKVVIVDPEKVIAMIVQRESTELEFKLNTDRDQPEVCFIQQALNILNDRVAKLSQLAGIRIDKTHSAGQIDSQTTTSKDSSYLFYQCSDGQHIYLNPFSTKILCHEYGSLENCPTEMRARILQMDWISMSEAWRKRFRYLSHLPLTCEFRLIEIDFKDSKLVSQDTYNSFRGQIEQREEEREKRRREELKRDKKIQVQQDRKIYGIQPTLNINLNSVEQFPFVSEDINPRNQCDEHSDPEIVDVEEDIINTTVATSFREIQLQEAALEARAGRSATRENSSTNANNHSSFAKLLVGAKSSQKQWTRNATKAAPQSGVATSSGQWPSVAQSSGNQPANTRQLLTSGSDDGGEELRAPPFECTISDFIDMNIVSSKKRGKKKH